MLFGLSYNAVFAVGLAAFTYWYGITYMPGVVGGLGGAGIAAAVLGAASYYLGVGDMVFGMLGM